MSTTLEAIRVREALVNANPAENSLRQKLARAYEDLGNRYSAQRNASLSAQYHDKALKERFACNWPSTKRIAESGMNIGMAVAADPTVKAAEIPSWLSRANIATALFPIRLEFAPEDAGVHEFLAQSFYAKAAMHQRLGNKTDAIENYLESIETLNQVQKASGPSDKERLANNTASLLMEVAKLQSEAGQRLAAADSFHAAAENLIASKSLVPDNLVDAVSAYCLCGALSTGTRADESFSAAVDLVKEIVASGRITKEQLTSMPNLKPFIESGRLAEAFNNSME